MYRSTISAWGLFIAVILNLVVVGVVVSTSGMTSELKGATVSLGVVVTLLALFVARASSRNQLSTLRAKADLALARTELSEQTQAIDFFADGLELGVFICDLGANVTYCNRTAVEMFNFQNPVGRSLMAITLSYELEQLVLRATKTGQSQAQEIVFTGPDERIAMVKAWFNQHSSHTFISVLDVTNLRRLERVRQDFVANVSHELRTPMAIIRAYAETLLDDADPKSEDLQNYLPKMIKEVDRLSGLTNDLLVLSTAELEQVLKHSCSFGSIITGVVTQLSSKAKDKGLDLTLEAPEYLFIEANSAQMTQVVLNLIDNAINYTVKGSVAVSVGLVGDRVIFKVRDTGIGIASEHSSRIFERFYRVDKGRSRSTGGTGLGLSIVKHIVEAHNGTVSVVSVIQQGTEFTVNLPIGNLESADSW